MEQDTVIDGLEASPGVFQEHGVIAAYLYGSVARDQHHADSDIDIAVLFEDDEGMPELDLAQQLQDALQLDREVDVRSLNSASVRFQHRVLKEGRRVYTGDREAMVRFEEGVSRRYLDMKPLQDRFDAIREARLTG